MFMVIFASAAGQRVVGSRGNAGNLIDPTILNVSAKNPALASEEDGVVPAPAHSSERSKSEGSEKSIAVTRPPCIHACNSKAQATESKRHKCLQRNTKLSGLLGVTQTYPSGSSPRIFNVGVRS
jgi:hypothetical protein